jgi:hypothetical protein
VPWELPPAARGRLVDPLPIFATLGIALRFLHYARNPSLWHDEAANVLNVLRKGFGELCGPLYGSSTGPPLFLWSQKLATLTLGESTFALRLGPLVASCAGLLLFVRIARRELPPFAAGCAVLIIAFSDRLLWHAAEARHYSLDFLVATALLALFSSRRGRPGIGTALWFAALAPVVIFASYPAVFICGGAFLVVAPALLRKHRREFAAAATLALSIAGSFAALYFLVLVDQRTAAVDAAWLNAFPDYTRPWLLPVWLGKSLIGVVDYATRPIGGLLIIAAGIGLGVGLRFPAQAASRLGGAVVMLALIAAIVGAYPFTGARTGAFAIPFLAIWIGRGLDEIRARTQPATPFRRLVWLAFLLPMIAVFLLASWRAVVPWPRADAAGAAAYVLAHRAPDEPVTANHFEFEYYFRSLGSWFFPDLHLPAARQAWIVATSRDSAERERLLRGFRDWQILERREFQRTTVFRVAQQPSSPP